MRARASGNTLTYTHLVYSYRHTYTPRWRERGKSGKSCTKKSKTSFAPSKSARPPQTRSFRMCLVLQELGRRSVCGVARGVGCSVVRKLWTLQ